MAIDPSAFDLEDFSFWDVNDDSLFTDHDVYLAALGNFGEGDGSISMNPSSSLSSEKKHSKHPKVLLSKNDKRRTYAKLFSEAFNSGDSKQLLNFLEAYCTNNCEVIQSCVVKENPYIPKHVEVRGIEAIHQYWSNFFITIPDCLIVMLETKLRIRNTPGSAASTSSSGNAGTSGSTVATTIGGTGGGNSSNAALSSSNSVSTTGNTTIEVSSGAISRSEGSSIVSSFSFTGTKLYDMEMEGAIVRPSLDSLHSAGSTGGSGTASRSTIGNIQALINKSQKNVKKRPLNSDWPANTPDPSHTGSSGAPGSAGAAGGAQQIVPQNPTSSNSGGNHDAADRYNIFLHPPRRFSTLAGTPFGGSGSHYFKNPPPPSNIPKTNDYVEITPTTKILPGAYMETEGYINFLGTLTMFLDNDNKISRFEFLYSHMD